MRTSAESSNILFCGPPRRASSGINLGVRGALDVLDASCCSRAVVHGVVQAREEVVSCVCAMRLMKGTSIDRVLRNFK